MLIIATVQLLQFHSYSFLLFLFFHFLNLLFYYIYLFYFVFIYLFIYLLFVRQLDSTIPRLAITYYEPCP